MLVLVPIGLAVGSAKQVVYTSTPAAQTVGKTNLAINASSVNDLTSHKGAHPA